MLRINRRQQRTIKLSINLKSFIKESSNKLILKLIKEANNNIHKSTILPNEYILQNIVYDNHFNKKIFITATKPWKSTILRNRNSGPKTNLSEYNKFTKTAT